jgi:hypothetical protein
MIKYLTIVVVTLLFAFVLFHQLLNPYNNISSIVLTNKFSKAITVFSHLGKEIHEPVLLPPNESYEFHNRGGAIVRSTSFKIVIGEKSEKYYVNKYLWNTNRLFVSFNGDGISKY